MLRFILKQERYDSHINFHTEAMFTVDIDVPELEEILTSGGSGEQGYSQTYLVGVEIKEKKDEEATDPSRQG